MKEKEHQSLDLSDINVFQQQYNLNYRRLKYYGMRYLADEDIISDFIQDLWLKIWEKKTIYANEAAFKQYLYQALYNTILNYIKHNKVVREYAEKKMNSDDNIEHEISCKIIESEVYQAINKVFDELPDSCRKVYAASLSGKSQKEISEEFSISINTVKKHINNANRYMKSRLKNFFTLLFAFK